MTRATIGLWVIVCLARAAHAQDFDNVITDENTRQVQALQSINTKLAGTKVRVGVMQYIAAAGSGQTGATVFAKNVGNKQLFGQFAPGLTFTGTDTIVYTVDQVDGAAQGPLTGAATEGAIDRAMHTWQSATCSPRIQKVTAPAADLGFIESVIGGITGLPLGGSFVYAGDIVHAGWQPGAFFDFIAPNGSTFILGITFTLFWTDADGNLIDTNHDGQPDVAVREIYYNNAFQWTTDFVDDFTSPLIDVESIALHESGHALSQAHFGKLFFDGKGTKEQDIQHLHFAPRAVMNAIYFDSQRVLLGTDNAGHCSIWANWP